MPDAYLLAGMGTIHLTEVRCLGSEKSLWNCRYKNITQEDCKHSEDAGVRCNIPYMGYETSVSRAGRNPSKGQPDVLPHRKKTALSPFFGRGL